MRRVWGMLAVLASRNSVDQLPPVNAAAYRMKLV